MGCLCCRYKVVLCRRDLPPTRENCVKILQATGIKGWQVGKTKVFLKYFHVDQLTDVLERMGKSAIALQVGTTLVVLAMLWLGNLLMMMFIQYYVSVINNIALFKTFCKESVFFSSSLHVCINNVT